MYGDAGAARRRPPQRKDPPEITSPAGIATHPAGRAPADATADIEAASSDDVRWANGLAFGGPTRFGEISAPLKQFLEGTGPLWAGGVAADKVATGFTSASHVHGGNESTLLALYNTLYHWGAIIVAPGYTDAAVAPAAGYPHGTAPACSGGPPGSDVLAAARHQGRRLAAIAGLIARGIGQEHGSAA